MVICRQLIVKSPKKTQYYAAETFLEHTGQPIEAPTTDLKESYSEKAKYIFKAYAKAITTSKTGDSADIIPPAPALVDRSAQDVSTPFVALYKHSAALTSFGCRLTLPPHRTIRHRSFRLARVPNPGLRLILEVRFPVHIDLRGRSNSTILHSGRSIYAIVVLPDHDWLYTTEAL